MTNNGGPYSLSGRAALVTGASSGLGRHFARRAQRFHAPDNLGEAVLLPCAHAGIGKQGFQFPRDHRRIDEFVVPFGNERLVGDDAVSGSLTTKNLSRWASRRLFDRLVELGAVRELSGRPTFRIYGI